jgi:hypothetical protein
VRRLKMISAVFPGLSLRLQDFAQVSWWRISDGMDRMLEAGTMRKLSSAYLKYWLSGERGEKVVELMM